MNIPRFSRYLIIAALVLASTPAFAGIFVSVNFAPPPLPVYAQPVCPDDGYIWVPGYWAYGEYGYYWVPGTWVQPPGFGLLWTPGYWGWDNDAFFFHSGYWGPHVGFYGGVNYGYGYGGRGYWGGRWNGGHFFYNRAVNNVDSVHIHNTYVDRTNRATTSGHVSFNGGNGGIQARPTAQEQQFSHERHIQPTSVQQAHVRTASQDRTQLATANGGKPATLAAARPAAYSRIAQQHAQTHPVSQQDKLKATQPAATHETKSSPAPQDKIEKHAAASSPVKHQESHPAETHHATAKPQVHAAPAHHSAPKPAAHAQPHPSAKPQAHSAKPQHK